MGTNDASRTRRSAWRCVAIALGAGVTLVFGGLATPDAQANTPRISYVLPAGSGTWAIQKTPSPKGATGSSYPGSYLSGLACPSTSACTAVGYYYNTADVQITLAEAWNGTAWSNTALLCWSTRSAYCCGLRELWG